MTEEEQSREIMSMVKERNNLRRELACLKKELGYCCRALKQASDVLQHSDACLEKTENGVIVPAIHEISYESESRELPELASIADMQKRQSELEKRLAELNEFLDNLS